jgi:hypothetical protein
MFFLLEISKNLYHLDSHLEFHTHVAVKMNHLPSEMNGYYIHQSTLKRVMFHVCNASTLSFLHFMFFRLYEI